MESIGWNLWGGGSVFEVSGVSIGAMGGGIKVAHKEAAGARG